MPESKQKTSVSSPKTTVCKPRQQKRSNRLWWLSKSLLRSKTFLLMSLKATLTGKQFSFKMRHQRAKLKLNYPAGGSRLRLLNTWSTSKHLHNSFFFSINEKHWPGLHLSSCLWLLSSLSLSVSHIYMHSHTFFQTCKLIRCVNVSTIAKGYGNTVVTMVTQISMFCCKQWKQAMS